MSFEIKFKVWIPYSNTMMRPKTIMEIQESAVSGVTAGQMKQWIWLQYSLMSDKNRLEIYSGDVLSVVTADDEEINVICEQGINERFTLDTGYLLEISSFYFRRQDGSRTYPIAFNYLGVPDLSMMEVIGNVYQNPELAF